jgi:hypothetical protein
MGTRTLRINDIDAATMDLRRFKSRSLLRRFRDYIENSDWDERLDDRLKWVNGVSLIGAAAAVLFVVSVGIRILF